MQCCMVLHGVLHGVICSVARCDMLFQLLSLGNQPTEQNVHQTCIKLKLAFNLHQGGVKGAKKSKVCHA
jgi:hypothetical protein